MNELPAATRVEFTDRHTALIVYGILTIVLGGGASALFAVVFALDLELRMTSWGLWSCAAAALAFVWLGVGSILARRWARALLLILATSAVILIAVSFVCLIALPQIAEALYSSPRPHPHHSIPPKMIAFTAINSVLYFAVAVMLPATWATFYGSQSVKATCDARDPVVRWTDRRPLPVLGFSLWVVAGTFAMLIGSASDARVLPFFGVYVMGPLAALGYLLLAAISLWSAWAMFKREVRGLWWFIASSCVLLASSAITYAQNDPLEAYRLTDLPPEQMEEIARTPLLATGTLQWAWLFISLFFVLYALYLKRFFPIDSARPVPLAAAAR